jgi:phosphate transport system substrate-binding protein
MAWGSDRSVKELTRHLTARAAGLLVAIWALSPALAENLVIQGSTTFNRRVMERHQAAIETASGQHLTVIPNKSTPGLVALLEGRAQMAMISAPLASEIEELRKVMPKCECDRLRAFEVMSVRIAIGVHPSNPVRHATLETIKKILKGEIKNWNELGGPDRPIRVALAAGGGILAVIEAEVLHGHAPALPNTLYISTPVQLVQVMEQEPGVIGFAQLTLVQQRGIPEIVTDRPLETTLNFVTAGEPTPAMRSVIDAAHRIANSEM